MYSVLIAVALMSPAQCGPGGCYPQFYPGIISVSPQMPIGYFQYQPFQVPFQSQYQPQYQPVRQPVYQSFQPQYAQQPAFAAYQMPFQGFQSFQQPIYQQFNSGCPGGVCGAQRRR